MRSTTPRAACRNDTWSFHDQHGNGIRPVPRVHAATMTGVHGGDAPTPTAADEAFATPADIGLHQRFLLPSKSPSWTCWMAVERLTVEIARRLQPAEEARVDLRCDPILARAGNAEPALVRPRNGSCSRRLSFLPFREILKA
jgi:hypothetical protein